LRGGRRRQEAEELGRMSADVTVIGALKGGVGKTRLAVLAALYLASRGKSVHVIDGDTVSQTAYEWQKLARKAGFPWPIEVTRHPMEDIDERIDELAADHDHVIADIGGGNRVTFEAALTRAKRLLVPIGADDSEMNRLPATWKSAKTAAEDSTVGGFGAYVVLSRTDHQTTLPREAREILTVTGKVRYPVCETELHKRVAYQRAFGRVPKDFLDVPRLLKEVGMFSETKAAR
jgi:chromosome partitioning protein